MTEQEKLALLEDTFDATEGSLAADMDLDDVKEWDSMTKLSLIIMMEDEFGKRLDSASIRGLKTVGDILNLMENNA